MVSLTQRKLTRLLSGAIFSTVLTFSILPLFSTAKAATPSDAFQRAEHLGLMISRLLESDLLESNLGDDPQVPAARPRHVYRLATYTYENAQFLREINGLATGEGIRTEAKDVTPGDVVRVLEATIASLKELAPIYNVDLDIPAPAITGEKTPADVLARLRTVNDGLQKLGTPRPLPNDVYRVALSIGEQAKAMTAKRKVKPTGKPTRVTKATPANALKETVKLIDDLDKLSKSNADFALPNGVTPPPPAPRGSSVTPGHVLLATQYALADVYALNIKLGYSQELVLPPIQSGKTPADVTNIIAEARLHLNALATSK